MKLCWWCKHFKYDSGCAGYSEYTPGWSASIGCHKNKYKKLRLEQADLEELRDRIEYAERCDSFEDKVNK